MEESRGLYTISSFRQEESLRSGCCTVSETSSVLTYYSRFRTLVPGVLAIEKQVIVQLSKLKVLESIGKTDGKSMITCYCLN